MNSLRQVLADYAVPLQLWLTPEARKSVAEPLIERLGDRIQIHTNPLKMVGELKGPAVLIIAASEIDGPQTESLKALSTLAHPGRAVMIGGTADRDVLMNAINHWGVVRVVPSGAPTETLLAAVMAAGQTLKREVALESAIDDLGTETTMLSSAIDHVDASREQMATRTRDLASTTFAAGLTESLRGEWATLEALANGINQEDSQALGLAADGVKALVETLEQATDRAIEVAAKIPNQAEALDPVLRRVASLLGAQAGKSLAGHIGTGCQSTVDPLALFHSLCHISQRLNGPPVVEIDAHRAGEQAIVELAFESNAPLVSSEEFNGLESIALIKKQGVSIEPHPTNSCRIRVTIPYSEASNA
jgi:hypothetical protein